MEEKLQILKDIFSEDLKTEDIKHGNYYGGVYNGRKYMYSDLLIKTLTPEKLERFIRKQIGSKK